MPLCVRAHTRVRMRMSALGRVCVRASGARGGGTSMTPWHTSRAKSSSVPENDSGEYSSRTRDSCSSCPPKQTSLAVPPIATAVPCQAVYNHLHGLATASGRTWSTSVRSSAVPSVAICNRTVGSCGGSCGEACGGVPA